METAPIIAGISLILIELIRSIPAYQRVKKTKTSDGISGSSLGVLAGMGLSWIFLAFLIHSWWILAANVIWLVIHLMLCREVAAVNPQKKKQIITTTLICAGILLITGIISTIIGQLQPALNIIVALTALFYGLPALYEGLKSATTQGLSLISLSVNSIEGLIYLLAGIGILTLSTAQTPITGFIFFGAVSIICNGLRLIRVSYRRIKKLDSLPITADKPSAALT
jgi:uncharacterized protein with PQ loop repeat